MTCVWLWLLKWGSRQEFWDHFLFLNQRLTFLCRCVCVYVCVCVHALARMCSGVCLRAYDELQLGTLGPLQTPFSRKHTVTTNWISLDKVFFTFSVVTIGPLYRPRPPCVSVCTASAESIRTSLSVSESVDVIFFGGLQTWARVKWALTIQKCLAR